MPDPIRKTDSEIVNNHKQKIKDQERQDKLELKAKSDIKLEKTDAEIESEIRKKKEQERQEEADKIRRIELESKVELEMFWESQNLTKEQLEKVMHWINTAADGSYREYQRMIDLDQIPGLTEQLNLTPKEYSEKRSREAKEEEERQKEADRQSNFNFWMIVGMLVGIPALIVISIIIAISMGGG